MSARSIHFLFMWVMSVSARDNKAVYGWERERVRKNYQELFLENIGQSRPLSRLFSSFSHSSTTVSISTIKMRKLASRPLSRLFSSFSHSSTTVSISTIKNEKIGVFGIWTRGRRMVGADKTTGLWRPPGDFLRVINKRSEATLCWIRALWLATLSQLTRYF